MNNKLRAMPPSNVRSQKIYLNPRVPANNPPMTGPIAVENCRTKTMALAHEKAAGYVERLTSGKCTDETPSLISRSNVCNYTGPLETLVRVSFGSVALSTNLPIEIVDELPAAWRNRNTINISTFCDNANPMLDTKNN